MAQVCMNTTFHRSKAACGATSLGQRLALILAALLAAGAGTAEVPGILSHQGKLTVEGASFNGTAQFKFALVNATGDTTWWSHNGTSADGNEPSGTPVALSVREGVFSVNLGDTNVQHMLQPIPCGVFTHDSVWLRIWVDDGVNGSQRLTPDRRITAAGYALVAGTAVAPAATATNFTGPLAGDVIGTQQATVVSTVGGLPAASVAAGANAANAATPDNTPGTLVRRDPLSGNFSSGTITGKFVGDGSGLTNLPTTPAAYQVPSGTVLVSLLADDPLLVSSGFQAVMTVPAPAWITGSTSNAPSARTGHSAVWDGLEVVIWGGSGGAGLYLNSGALYRPYSDSWTPINGSGAPAGRSGHTAVWTGNEMIVWGGVGNDGHLDSGGRFTPGTQTWALVNPTNAPVARRGHHAVWTGSRMLVWGGVNNSGLLSDGALYDPIANLWTPLATPNPPEARFGAAAVWASDRFIVWGGNGEGGELGSGAQLLFLSGVPTLWSALSPINAPSPRSGHSALWTGDQMLVWGGRTDGIVQGNGAAFRPAFNAWIPFSPTNAPSARADHAAVWTGLEMLIVDGADASGDLSTGAAYDPVTLQWRALSNLGSPLVRSQTTAAWTGLEIMVFGGMSGGQRVGSLQRLVPQPTWYLYRKL